MNDGTRAGSDDDNNQLDWGANFATKAGSGLLAADDGRRTADKDSKGHKKRHGPGGEEAVT